MCDLLESEQREDGKLERETWNSMKSVSSFDHVVVTPSSKNHHFHFRSTPAKTKIHEDISFWTFYLSPGNFKKPFNSLDSSNDHHHVPFQLLSQPAPLHHIIKQTDESKFENLTKSQNKDDHHSFFILQGEKKVVYPDDTGNKGQNSNPEFDHMSNQEANDDEILNYGSNKLNPDDENPKQVFQPTEPSDYDLEHFDYDHDVHRDSDDSGNLWYAEVSERPRTRKSQLLDDLSKKKKGRRSFNPCGCCRFGSLRIWSFVIAVSETFIFFLNLTFLIPLTVRTGKEMNSAHGNNGSGESNHFIPAVSYQDFKTVHDVFNFYLVLTISLSIAFIIAILWVISAGWGCKYLCLVYAVLKIGVLLVIPLYIFTVCSPTVQSDFAFYLFFWPPQIYFIVCAVGLFTQYRAGIYSRVRVQKRDPSKQERKQRQSIINSPEEEPPPPQILDVTSESAAEADPRTGERTQNG